MNRTHKTSGFTLVELAVVVVIIGVLAAFGVPRFMDAVERSKASEAFAYLDAVRGAQERYAAREGTYASSVAALDIKMQPPKYFTAPDAMTAPTNTLESCWSLTLTRLGASAGYGSYTVCFTQDGFDTSSANSTIILAPTISPLASPSGNESTSH